MPNDATQRVLQAHFTMGLMPASERGHIMVTFRNIGKTPSGDVIAKGEMRIESLTSEHGTLPKSKARILGLFSLRVAPTGNSNSIFRHRSRSTIMARRRASCPLL